MSFRATPSAGWSLLLIGIYLGVQSVLSTPLVAWSALTSHRLTLNLTLVGVVSALSFGVTVWIAAILSRHPWRSLLAAAKPPAALLPAVIFLALGTALVCSEVYNVTLALLPMPKWVEQLFGTLFDVRSNPIGAAIALAVVAPIAEEFICRRWLLESLLQRWPAGRSIVVSGVVFGAMHLNPWQFFYATVLGLAIGWFYARTRSVTLCILWHALNNSLVVVVAYWVPELEGFRQPAPGTVEFHPAWLNATAAVLCAAGALLAWRQTRHLTPIAFSAPLPAPPPLPPSAAATDGPGPNPVA